MRDGFSSGAMSLRAPLIAFGANTERENVSVGATDEVDVAFGVNAASEYLLSSTPSSCSYRGSFMCSFGSVSRTESSTEGLSVDVSLSPALSLFSSFQFFSPMLSLLLEWLIAECVTGMFCTENVLKILRLPAPLSLTYINTTSGSLVVRAHNLAKRSDHKLRGRQTVQGPN